MPLKKRTLFRVVGAMAALVLLAGVTGIVVVRSAWFNGKVRQFIVGTVEKATGGRVEVATFRFDWKHMRAEVHEFVLHGKEPADKPPLFRAGSVVVGRSEEHTSEPQSLRHLVCRLLLEKKKNIKQRV